MTDPVPSSLLRQEGPQQEHECDGTNIAIAEDGRQYCAHCGWNDPKVCQTCRGSGFVAYWDGSAYAGEGCPDCPDEPATPANTTSDPQPEDLRLVQMLRRLAETQRNLPVPLSDAERDNLRSAARLLEVKQARIVVLEGSIDSDLIARLRDYHDQVLKGFRHISRAEEADLIQAAIDGLTKTKVMRAGTATGGSQRQPYRVEERGGSQRRRAQMKDVHGHEWFGRVCKVCGTTSDRMAAMRRCVAPAVSLSSTASNTDADDAPAFTMPTFDPSPSFDSTPDSSPSVDTSFDAGFSGGDSGGGGGGSDY